MSPLDALLLRLDTNVWRIDRGDRVALGELHAMAQICEELAPSLDQAELARLNEHVARVRKALADGCERLQLRIGEVRRGRRGTAAYIRVARSHRVTP